MLFAVRFYDRPERQAVRNRFLSDHIEWLRQHKDVIRLGGSLRMESGSEAIGGLWIVECESKAVIEDLLRTDPFWIQGLREKYEVHCWHRAWPEPVTI